MTGFGFASSIHQFMGFSFGKKLFLLATKQLHCKTQERPDAAEKKKPVKLAICLLINSAQRNMQRA
jgi:hypothetical protein